MKMSTQLSVSSAILAAVLSGCSQQQVIGGSQVQGGSQISGGSQVLGGGSQQVAGGSQVGGSQSQIEGGSQVSGSQQQVEAAAPVVVARPQPAPQKAAPVRVYRPQPKRVYTRGPKPRVAQTVKRRGTGLPPARPGQCFAKVKVPAKYVTKSKRVLVQKAASKKVLARAPQYRWVNKKVLVRPASHINRTVPAVYRTINKRVMVKPAYNTWRKGHGAITRIDHMTGEIMCRVTVPAVYKNVQQRVLVRPAQTVRKFVPAVYKTVRQKQRVSGAIYKTINRPARYKTVNYRVKTAGARYVWRPVLCKTNAPKHYAAKKRVQAYKAVKRKPVMRSHTARKQYRPNQGVSYAEYLKVMNAPLPSKRSKMKRSSKKKMMKKEVMQPVVKPKAVVPKAEMPKATPQPEAKMAPKAETNTAEKPSKTAIKQNIVYGIQAALKAKGFNPGKLDGKMGPSTAAALKAFQSSRGLPVGVLSKDTFKALGLVR